MRAMQTHDGDHRGSARGPHLQRRPEVDRMLHEAVAHTLKENALNPTVFPSLREMQRDAVSSPPTLHGGEETGGAMTWGHRSSSWP
jgi:glutamate/tyrosine decarboxylase-like PLP-dependent enzyme